MKLPFEELVNIEVTTASKRAEKISDAPGCVYVVSHKEIRERGGGIFEFEKRETQLSFSVNINKAKNAKLSLSSQLLKLATHVKEEKAEI